jgi:hypothetical protein
MSPGIFYLVGSGPDVFADALVQPEQLARPFPFPQHHCRPPSAPAMGPRAAGLLAPMVIGLPNTNGKPFMSSTTNPRFTGIF